MQVLLGSGKDRTRLLAVPTVLHDEARQPKGTQQRSLLVPWTWSETLNPNVQCMVLILWAGVCAVALFDTRGR